MLKPMPFQNRRGRFFRAYFENVKELLLHPTDFFKKYTLFTETSDAVLFAYLNTLFVCIFGVLLQAVVIGVLYYYVKASGKISINELFPDLPPMIVESLPKILTIGAGVFYCVLLMIAPFVQLAISFIWSGVHHMFLLVVGGTKQGFSKTLQVNFLVTFVFVVSIPFLIFMAIPILGGLVSLGFGIFALVYKGLYFVLGIAETQGISTTRAFLSWFAMWFVCCCLLVLPFLLMLNMIPDLLTGLSQLPNQ